MNSAARAHLLATLTHRAAPLAIATARATPDDGAALMAALRSLRHASLVLPAEWRIQFIAPRGVPVHVVAGKGGKRRGVRR